MNRRSSKIRIRFSKINANVGSRRRVKGERVKDEKGVKSEG
jgi:hypothetical protein